MQRLADRTVLPSSDTPKLLMPTFRTYEGDYRDGIAGWWGLVDTFVRVFPTIHNPDGLFFCVCSANLTFHHVFSIRLHRKAKRGLTIWTGQA